MHATALTLLLLRAHTSAYGRQRRRVLQNLCSRKYFPTLNILYKRRYVDVHRASLHARRLGTVKTTLCLCQCHVHSESLVYLFLTRRGTISRFKLRHDDTVYGSTLLWFSHRTQFLAPHRITVRKYIHAAFSMLVLRNSIGNCDAFVRLHGLFFCNGSKMLFKMFQILLLHTPERTHASEHFIPVNKGTVKLRTVDADKLCLSAYRKTACTAHARTVHHYGIQ